MKAIDAWIKLNQCVKTEFYIGTKAMRAIDDELRNPPPKVIPKAKSSYKGAKSDAK